MKPQIPWLRVFVEGVVIVSSTLLAFVIDSFARVLLLFRLHTRRV